MIILGLILILLLLVLGGVLLLLMGRMLMKQEQALKETLYQNNKANNEDIDLLKRQLQRDLIQFQNILSSSMRGDLNTLNENTHHRLASIEKRVNESLLTGFDRTNKAFASVLEQMAKIDQTQENLKSLSSNITNLQNVLTDKKTRGTWGEIELYSILETVFGNNQSRFSKQHKLSNGSVVDAILFAPEPLGKIAIDSKFPLENYNRLLEVQGNKEEEIRIRKNFSNDVKKHIKDISEKYIIPGETAEIAYMFIPAEAVFAEIVGHFNEIMDYSYANKVYLVSPTTLMAYITAIKAIYLGQERNEKVVEIQEEFIKLAREFERYNLRFESVTKDFDKTYKDLQSVATTSDKIMKRFKQIEAVELESQKNQEVKINHHENIER